MGRSLRTHGTISRLITDKRFYRKSFHKTEPCAFMCLWPGGIKGNFIWQVVKGQSETCLSYDDKGCLRITASPTKTL